jgi:hypothetical protein
VGPLTSITNDPRRFEDSGWNDIEVRRGDGVTVEAMSENVMTMQ